MCDPGRRASLTQSLHKILLWERRLAAIRAGDGAPAGLYWNFTCLWYPVSFSALMLPQDIRYAGNPVQMPGHHKQQVG